MKELPVKQLYLRGTTHWPKILALEEERAFNNTSVTGGVDRFIQKHTKAITEELGNSGIHRIILRIPYQGLTQDERPWWVEQWRAVMSRMQQPSSPEPPNQRLEKEVYQAQHGGTGTTKKEPHPQ